MFFLERDWFKEELGQIRARNLDVETIKTLGNIEDIFSIKGALRILITLFEVGIFRYAQLQDITILHLGTLNRALKLLIWGGFVKTTKKKVESPRKETVTIYSLTDKGHKFCDILFSQTAFLTTIKRNKKTLRDVWK